MSTGRRRWSFRLGDISILADQDCRQALRAYERAITLFRQSGNLLGVIWSLQGSASAEYLMGEPYARARRLMQEALALLRSVALDTMEVDRNLKGMACLAWANGELERAARLYAAVEKRHPENPGDLRELHASLFLKLLR